MCKLVNTTAKMMVRWWVVRGLYYQVTTIHILGITMTQERKIIPLVNLQIYKTTRMKTNHNLKGNITISTAIFNSYFYITRGYLSRMRTTVLAYLHLHGWAILFVRNSSSTMEGMGKRKSLFVWENNVCLFGIFLFFFWIGVPSFVLSSFFLGLCFTMNNNPAINVLNIPAEMNLIMTTVRAMAITFT